jgi:hypothetical protein
VSEYAFRGSGLSSFLGMLAMDRRPRAVLTIGTFVFPFALVASPTWSSWRAGSSLIWYVCKDVLELWQLYTKLMYNGHRT